LVNFDKPTYAGNLHNLASVAQRPGYHSVHADICDRAAVDEALRQHQPRAIVHFAAEGHVDRSIVGPAFYVVTNVNGMASTSANGRVSDTIA
jgi:dTDP-glucose 4,6-dehydratase